MQIINTKYEHNINTTEPTSLLWMTEEHSKHEGYPGITYFTKNDAAGLFPGDEVSLTSASPCPALGLAVRR